MRGSWTGKIWSQLLYSCVVFRKKWRTASIKFEGLGTIGEPRKWLTALPVLTVGSSVPKFVEPGAEDFSSHQPSLYAVPSESERFHALPLDFLVHGSVPVCLFGGPPVYGSASGLQRSSSELEAVRLDPNRTPVPRTQKHIRALRDKHSVSPGFRLWGEFRPTMLGTWRWLR